MTNLPDIGIADLPERLVSAVVGHTGYGCMDALLLVAGTFRVRFDLPHSVCRSALIIASRRRGSAFGGRVRCGRV